MRVKLTLKPSIPALALLAIGSVGLAACGDDDGDNQAQANTKEDQRHGDRSRQADASLGPEVGARRARDHRAHKHAQGIS
jgi:hypothetical protein